MHYFANKHQNTQCIYKPCHNYILIYNNVYVNLIQALDRRLNQFVGYHKIIQYNTGLLSNTLSLL